MAAARWPPDPTSTFSSSLPSIEDRRVGESIVEFMLYALWDTRQKVGHATRTVDDCIRLAKTDNTILTAILEARFICGDVSALRATGRRFPAATSWQRARGTSSPTSWPSVTSAIVKSGESRYLVEPDVKDGKGGLRDLNTLFWIAKFLLTPPTPPTSSPKRAPSTREELAIFKKCEDFLWAVRCHLHFLAERGDDRLSFDRQSEIWPSGSATRRMAA